MGEDFGEDSGGRGSPELGSHGSMSSSSLGHSADATRMSSADCKEKVSISGNVFFFLVVPCCGCTGSNYWLLLSPPGAGGCLLSLSSHHQNTKARDTSDFRTVREQLPKKNVQSLCSSLSRYIAVSYLREIFHHTFVPFDPSQKQSKDKRIIRPPADGPD